MAGAALAGGFFAASSSSELESSSEDSSLADLARAALAGVTFVAGFFTSLAGEGLTGAALPAGFLAVSSSELESRKMRDKHSLSQTDHHFNMGNERVTFVIHTRAL